MAKRKKSTRFGAKRRKTSVQVDEVNTDDGQSQDSASSSSLEGVQPTQVNTTGVIVPEDSNSSEVIDLEAENNISEEIVRIEEADSSSEIIVVASPSPPIMHRTAADEIVSQEQNPASASSEITTSQDIGEESKECEMEVLVSNCEAEPVLREVQITTAEKSTIDENNIFIQGSKISDFGGDSQHCPNTSTSASIEPTLELPDIVATAFAQVFDHSPLLLPRTSSMIPVESVKGIVRGTGRPNFSGEAIAHIAMDATFVTKLLLQEANKFREAGKRSSLDCTDIDRALNLLAAKQPVFGIGLPAQIKSSLQEKTSSKVFYEKNQFLTPEILAADLKNLSVPRGPSVLSHWLITADSLDVLYWPEKPDIDVEQIFHNCETDDENEVDDNLEDDLIHGQPQDTVENMNPSQLFEFLMKSRSGFSCRELIHLRSQSCGLLTKELECYFQTLCAACVGHSEDKRNVAIASLEHDPNMIPLASFIVSFIVDQVEYYVAYPDMKKLQNLLTMTKQLMLNEYITANMKHYLHMIVPAVMTCIVCSTVCANPEYEHHWQLRNNAADLLKFICDKHSNDVNNIQGRAVKVLKKALRDSSNKSSGTVYGILYALKAFGADIVKPELEYINTVVKKQADFVLSSPITVDSTNRTNSVRIKDLISQIVQLVDKNGTPKIPKIKTRIVSKDHIPRFDNAKSNSRPQPLITRKPPPPRKAVPAPSKPAPTIPTGPRPMPIPRFPSLGPTSKPAEVTIAETVTPVQVATPVSPKTQNKQHSSANISTYANRSPPPLLVHPSKIFHTYTLKTLPIPRPPPKNSRQRPRTSNKPVSRRLPAAVSPSFPFPRTPMAFPGTAIISPGLSSPNPPSPGQSARKYVLVPLQNDSRVPSLEAINSLLKGQLPSNASIVSPENILPVDVIPNVVDAVPEQESAETADFISNRAHIASPASKLDASVETCTSAQDHPTRKTLES